MTSIASSLPNTGLKLSQNDICELEKVSDFATLNENSFYSDLLKVPETSIELIKLFISENCTNSNKIDQTIISGVRNYEISLSFKAILANLQSLSRDSQKSNPSSQITNSSYEDAKAEWKLEKTELEQVIHETETKYSIYKNKCESFKDEINSLKITISEQNSKLSNLDSTNKELSSKLQVLSSKKNDSDNLMSDIKEEKQNLMIQLSERRSEIDSYKNKIESYKKFEAELRTKIVEMEQKIEQYRSSQDVFDVKEHVMQQSIEISKSQVLSLTKELNETHKQLQDIKRSYSKLKSENEAKLDKISNELNLYIDQFTHAKSDLESTREKLRIQSSKSSSLNQALLDQEDHFKAEMSAQKKLTHAWEQSANEAKKRLSDLDSELLRLESNQNDIRNSNMENIKNLEKELTEMKKKSEFFEDKYKVTEEQLYELRRLVSESDVQSGLLSPSSKVSASMFRQNVSLPQLWSQNMELVDMLEAEKEEKSRLESTLQEMLNELEERAPIIEAEREAFREQQEELAQALKIQNTLEDKVNALSNQIESKNDTILENSKEIKSLTLESKDLSRQVSKLLRTINELRNTNSSTNHTSYQNEDVQNNNNQADIHSIISKELVTFSDIQEMQSQNQRLLRSIRELAEKVEEEEKKNRREWEESESQAVQAAHDTIEQLAAKVRTLQSRISVLEKGNEIDSDIIKSTSRDNNSQSSDFTPKLNSEISGAADLNGNIGEKSLDNNGISEQFEAYRVESQITCDQLREDVDSYRKNQSELKVSLGQLQAKYELLEQQLSQLNQDYLSRGRELDHLTNNNNRLMSQVEAYEAQMDKLNSSIQESNEKTESVSRELTIVSIERDVLKKSESQWLEDMERWKKDRDGLTSILQSTTRMREEWREMSENQVAEVKERLLKSEENVLNEKRNAEKWEGLWRSVEHQKNAIVNDLQSKLDLLSAQATEMQGVLNNKDLEILNLSANIKDMGQKNSLLQAELDSINLRLKEEEHQVKMIKQTDLPESVNLLLKDAANKHRSELEKVLKKSQVWEQRAAMFKEMADGLEHSLNDLKKTYDDYKSQTIREIDELKAKCTEFSESESVKSSKISDLESKLNGLQNVYESTLASLEKSKNTSVESEKSYNAMINQLKSSLESQLVISKEKQDLYERELVSHAKDIETTLSIRSQVENLNEQIRAVKADLTSVSKEKLELEEILKNEKSRFENMLSALESRSKQLERQNEVLLSNLETSSTRAIIDDMKNTSSKLSNIENNETSAINATNNSLGEVISFQRHERDLAIAKAESLSLEVSRYKQLYERTQKSMDEARIELAKLTSEYQIDDNGDTSAGGPIRLTESQHAEWRQKLQESTLLRESNTILRQQLENTKNKVKNLEEEISKQKEEFNIVNENQVSLSAELDVRRQEINILEESNLRWQKRHEQILAKYERIDPEEHESLKKQVSSLSSKNSELSTKLDEELRSSQSKIQERVNAIRTELDSKLISFRKMASEKEIALNKQINELKNSLKVTGATISNQASQIQLANKQIESFKKILSERDLKEQDLLNSLEKAKHTIDKLNSDLEESEKTMQAKIGKNLTWKTRFDLLRKQSLEKLSNRSEKINELRETIKELTGSYPEESNSSTVDSNNISQQNPTEESSNSEINSEIDTNSKNEQLNIESDSGSNPKNSFNSQDLNKLNLELISLKSELQSLQNLNNELKIENEKAKALLSSQMIKPGPVEGLSEHTSATVEITPIITKHQLLISSNDNNGLLETQEKVHDTNLISEYQVLLEKYNYLQKEAETLSTNVSKNDTYIKSLEQEKDILMQKYISAQAENPLNSRNKDDQNLESKSEYSDPVSKTPKDQILDIDSVVEKVCAPVEIGYEDQLKKVNEENLSLIEQVKTLEEKLKNLDSLYNKDKQAWADEKLQLRADLEKSRSLYEKLKSRALVHFNKASELSKKVKELQEELNISKSSKVNSSQSDPTSEKPDGGNAEISKDLVEKIKQENKLLSVEEAQKLAKESSEWATSELAKKHEASLNASIDQAKRETEMRAKLQVQMAERKAVLLLKRVNELESILKSRSQNATIPNSISSPIQPLNVVNPIHSAEKRVINVPSNTDTGNLLKSQPFIGSSNPNPLATNNSTIQQSAADVPSPLPSTSASSPAPSLGIAELRKSFLKAQQSVKMSPEPKSLKRTISQTNIESKNQDEENKLTKK
ncbi:Nucleoporin [Smittium culicis]|uniref:Nucleoporin n=1 Tax=Smittium culicis TaxID=133412 RepID=A0A1R1Y0L1_9FUNG|nr:Nucleoporin [Smittium culicis]